MQVFSFLDSDNSPHALGDQCCTESSEGTWRTSGFSLHEALSSVLFCAGYPSLCGLTRLSAPSLHFQSPCGSTWVAPSCTTAWDYILQTWAIMGLTAFILCLSDISILCCLIFSALRTVFFFIYFVSTFAFLRLENNFCPCKSTLSRNTGFP